MVSGRAVNWRVDLADVFESFRRKPRVFDNIAGETNELGRKLIDRPNYLGRIRHVAFMVKVSEMNEAAIPRASIQIEFRDVQRCRFDEPRIGPKRRR